MANKEISIIKDYWDFNSFRVQIATSFFLLAASLIAFWLLSGNIDWQVADLSLLSISNNQSVFLSPEIASAVNLVLHTVTSFITGLILFEISKHYGNRWGSGPAIWTALIFAINPVAVIMLNASDSSRIISAILLATTGLYCYLRFINLKENPYFFVSWALIISSFTIDQAAGLTGLATITLARVALFKKDSHFNPFNPNPKVMNVLKFLFLFSLPWIVGVKLLTTSGFYATVFGDGMLYSLTASPERLIDLSGNSILTRLTLIFSIIVASIFALRVLAGKVWLRPIVFSLLWLLSAFIIAIGFGSGAIHLPGSSITFSVAFYHIAQALSLTLVLMALPLADIINKPTALIFSVTGCLFLSLLFISWGSRFYSLNTEDYLVKKQFKTYHSISDTIALSYPGKSLFLIGFPESLKNYYRSHRLVYGSNWTDKLIYDKHPQTAPNHITNFGCSFMNTDKPPVYLKWNDINETFTAVKHSGAENLSLSSQDLVQSISVSPDSIPVINSSEPGRIELFEPFISRGENKIEVTSGISPFAIWFHSPSLNPVKCNTLEITATFRSSEANKKDNGKIHLIFEAPESKSPQKTLLKPSDKNKYSLWNSPEWIGSSSIERFGIEFEPGIYNFELSGITFLDTQPGRSAQKKEEKPYGL